MSRQHRSSEERSRVELTGKFRTGSGRVHVVRVSDLSASGCRLHQNFTLLDVGKTIVIRLAEIGPIDAEVRWTRGMDIGISFHQPLHPAVLDHLLNQYRQFEPAVDGDPDAAVPDSDDREMF